MDFREYAPKMAAGELSSEKTVEFKLTPLGESSFQQQIISHLGKIEIKQALHPLLCGHIVGSVGPQEFVGLCQKCGSSVCYRPECHSLCERCGFLICSSCTHRHEDLPYCKKCRSIVFTKQAVVSGLLGLHHILKGDIDDG